MERGLPGFFSVRALETRERPFSFCRTAVRPAGPSKRAAAIARDGARREGRHRREQRGPRGGRRRRALGRFSLYWALRAASFLPLHFLFHFLLIFFKACVDETSRKSSTCNDSEPLTFPLLAEPPRFAVLAAGGRRRVAAAATTHVLRAVLQQSTCVNQNLVYGSFVCKSSSILACSLLRGGTEHVHMRLPAAKCSRRPRLRSQRAAVETRGRNESIPSSWCT